MKPGSLDKPGTGGKRSKWGKMALPHFLNLIPYPVILKKSGA
jgi:hypothetical protein